MMEDWAFGGGGDGGVSRLFENLVMKALQKV